MNQLPERFRNRILASLPKDEIARFAGSLTPITLNQDHVLIDGTAPYCYFLEDGIASVVVVLQNGDTVEVGVVGVEGIVGVPALLGARSVAGRTFMQIAGSGFRIPAEEMKAEFELNRALRQRVQRYMQAFFVQTAQTAACNRLHTIEERLARWILACKDRMETDELHLTHEFLGQMLGSPRTTVTLAAGLLHRAGMIEYSRGVVTIKDRRQLENAACECYAVVREAYAQVWV